ncbi:MAG: DNA-directed RNA polymerase subunit RpoH/Rpb5 C-terminal domain-containing protein [Thermoplasmata archaeon]
MTPARSRTRKSKGAAATPAPTPRPFIAHHLVPPHELLTEAEGGEVLKQLSTSLERLPKILVSDPGLKTDPKFVAAREAREPLNGRLVRIRRPSSTAGEAVAYRVLAQNLGE